MMKHSTRYGLNPLIPHPDHRPRCKHPDCNRSVAIISCLKDGRPNYRAVCQWHHHNNIAVKNGVKSAKHLTAQRQGKTITEYQNERHPYLRYRGDKCQNRDGSVLGYKCTHRIRLSGQLHVDHIDGNPYNNSRDNLQTLCMMCHYEKTMLNKDYLTPGRKQRKVSQLFTGLFEELQ
jgi:hypothetical protein